MRGRKPIPFDDPSVTSIRKSTSLDIAWLAGFYEGEGHCRCVNDDVVIIINQKQLQPLIKCKEVFGGKIGTYAHPTSKTINQWRVNGTRALGILFTIYSYLSIEKREQIKNAMIQSKFGVALSSNKINLQELTKLINS